MCWNNIIQNKYLPNYHNTGRRVFCFVCFSDKVPILEKKKLPVVGIGKHLCGAATGMRYIC